VSRVRHAIASASWHLLTHASGDTSYDPGASGPLRCRNERCDRQIFAERLPGIAAPSARQTDFLAEIVRLRAATALFLAHTGLH
jgi:hypothetical protein